MSSNTIVIWWVLHLFEGFTHGILCDTQDLVDALELGQDFGFLTQGVVLHENQESISPGYFSGFFEVINMGRLYRVKVPTHTDGLRGHLVLCASFLFMAKKVSHTNIGFLHSHLKTSNVHYSRKMEFFTSAIEKYTAHLLSSISTDYGLNLDELKAKYIGVKVVKAKVPKVPMADRPMCAGTVGKKKEPCKNKARVGETTCHIHGEKPPVDMCQPCKVPQVPAPAPAPAPAPVQAETSLADSVRNLANIAAQVTQEIKVKKPKKKKVLEAPPPPAPVLVEEPEEPEPEPEVLDDLDARLKAMLASGATFDDDEDDDEEPESPGAVRHREILENKGVAWEEYYDDEEDDELEEEEELEED